MRIIPQTSSRCWLTLFTSSRLQGVHFIDVKTACRHFNLYANISACFSFTSPSYMLQDLSHQVCWISPPRTKVVLHPWSIICSTMMMRLRVVYSGLNEATAASVHLNILHTFLNIEILHSDARRMCYKYGWTSMWDLMICEVCLVCLIIVSTIKLCINMLLKTKNALLRTWIAQAQTRRLKQA